MLGLDPEVQARIEARMEADEARMLAEGTEPEVVEIIVDCRLRKGMYRNPSTGFRVGWLRRPR